MKPQEVCPGSGTSVSVNSVTGMWAECPDCGRTHNVWEHEDGTLTLRPHKHTPYSNETAETDKAKRDTYEWAKRNSKPTQE
jgi:hypothetical protein